MTRPSLPRRAALALAAGLLVSAASAQPSPRGPAGLDARLDQLATALDLGADQRAALADVAARYADADRPALWSAASGVERVLTDAQVADLRVRLDARREARADRARAGRRGDRARPARGERGARPARGDRRERGERPTDEQREAVQAVRERYRPRAEALRAAFDAGEITAETFAAERRALRDAARADVRAALPADLRDRLDDRADRREAEREARAQALGLTDEQRDALRALRLDRPGDRADRSERPTAEERQARRAEAAAILTTDQRDVLFLHRVLAARPGRAARRGGRTGAATPLTPEVGALRATDAPAALVVESVSPNPAAGRVRVAYAVPEGGAVRLDVFDVRGRRVLGRSVQAGGAGRQTATLDVGDLGPGVYVVRVTAGGATAESRLTVAR